MAEEKIEVVPVENKGECFVDSFAGQTIYLGPEVPKYGLIKNRVYRGAFEIPDKASAAYPLIRHLFVPVSDMNRCTMAMESKGTPEYIALHQIIGGKE